jgi:hypothetical protein
VGIAALWNELFTKKIKETAGQMYNSKRFIIDGISQLYCIWFYVGEMMCAGELGLRIHTCHPVYTFISPFVKELIKSAYKSL